MEPSDSAKLLAAVERLDARVARLEAEVGRVTGLLDLAPAAIATLADSFDDHAGRALDAGLDVRIARVATLVARVDGALAQARLQAPIARPAGPFGFLRGLLDRDVQQALGCVLRLLRAFGAALRGMPAAPRLPVATGGRGEGAR